MMDVFGKFLNNTEVQTYKKLLVCRLRQKVGLQ
jgi:hypothetical protein